MAVLARPLPAPPAFLEDLPPSSGLALRRWTPDEFRRMTAADLFGPGERLELANGEILERGLPRPLHRAEYYALAELGILGHEERTELIYGRVIKRMSPIGRPHSIVVSKTAAALADAFGAGWTVEQQLPIQLSDGMEPQPDVAVFSGVSDDYPDVPSASDAVLLVEVSQATLRYDRGTKARLYAAAGVPEYWLLNLSKRTLEVRRQPESGVYRTLEVYDENGAIAPVSAPNAPVRVADLLPLRRSP